MLNAEFGVVLQGYCKALILSIERLLGVLNVERLVLPAAEGAEGIWVNKFGFSQLSDEEVGLVSLSFAFRESILKVCVCKCVFGVNDCLLLPAWGSVHGNLAVCSDHVYGRVHLSSNELQSV